MSNDVRISTALPSHPKTKKLIRRTGSDGGLCLVWLFLWAGNNRPDGDLSGMNAEDIELAVDWNGPKGAFVEALVDVRFLEVIDDGYLIHDWEKHNPWAAGSEARSLKAKWNAVKRHHGEEAADAQVPEYAAYRKQSASKKECSTEQPAYEKHASSNASSTNIAMHEHTGSNAPIRTLSESYPPPNETTLFAPEHDHGATTTRKGRLCKQLRAIGIDAAPHRLDESNWVTILTHRTDEEIIAHAEIVTSKKPGHRITLGYLAPGLLDPPARVPPADRHQSGAPSGDSSAAGRVRRANGRTTTGNSPISTVVIEGGAK